MANLSLVFLSKASRTVPYDPWPNYPGLGNSKSSILFLVEDDYLEDSERLSLEL